MGQGREGSQEAMLMVGKNQYSRTVMGVSKDKEVKL